MTSAYISRRVATPQGLRAACVLVEDDLIVGLAGYDAVPAGAMRIELGNDVLLPGLVDTHVHLNEPGRTDWEGFATGTRAAAAGGITTVVDMPLNCLPETTTPAALEQKRQAAAGQLHVDWRAWGGVVGDRDAQVADNLAELAPLAAAGAAGFKCFLLYPGCDGFGQVDPTHLRAAMPVLASLGLPLLVHAELPGPLLAAGARLTHADWTRYATYLASRPDEAEVAAIELLIGLAREFGVHVHIVHLASAQALALLRSARAEGLPVTVETCPHYLHAAAETIADGATLWKCAPPIRSAANRELLWQALAEGTIDLVASDHSPCPPALKQAGAGDFGQAWGGIASLSLGLPVLWTGMRQRGLPVERLADWMAAAPARLAGLKGRKGEIAPGCDADLVVFDPAASFSVTEPCLHFRHALSPYLGERLYGVVKRTILRGHDAYLRGAAFPDARGREVLR